MTVARHVIDERRLEVSVSVAPGPFRMLADPTRLEQVIVNLLTNAAKYTEPGGHVFVRLERETLSGETNAVLSVRDTGRGIPPAMLETVFDLFVQVTPNRHGNTGGLGLGLTVVKGLVEMHGGSVTARSEGTGTGSEFIVRLPLPESGPRAPERPDEPGTERDSAPRLRVVLVEDSEDVREMLSECLRGLGHDVKAADNGTDGVAKVLGVRPDVVLVDVGLPSIDGYEVARRVRAAPGGGAFFMIALTGYGGNEARDEAHRAGFDLHLTKPVDIDRLAGILRQAHEARFSLRTD
jgi:CheY-like chemotaxis protein